MVFQPLSPSGVVITAVDSFKTFPSVEEKGRPLRGSPLSWQSGSVTALIIVVESLLFVKCADLHSPMNDSNTPTELDDSSPFLWYSKGDWKTETDATLPVGDVWFDNFHNKTYHTTDKDGDWVRLSWVGTGIEVVGTKNSE